MRLPWGVRWWELAPEALLGLGLGVFAATEWSAATSALSSGRAIVLMGVVAVGWAALRFVLVRYTRWPALRVVVFGFAALGILKVVVFPAYTNTTVVEVLPVATVITQETTPAQSAATAPTTPVALRTGAFHGIKHRASGTAVVYRQPDGTLTVGLEDIDIQPGPDYDVYVVPGADREAKGGGTRLDDLRGNKGTQFYGVPDGVAVEQGEWTVLVWCQTFGVPVAAATPE
jgi:hypothetical protein